MKWGESKGGIKELIYILWMNVYHRNREEKKRNELYILINNYIVCVINDTLSTMLWNQITVDLVWYILRVCACLCFPMFKSSFFINSLSNFVLHSVSFIVSLPNKMSTTILSIIFSLFLGVIWNISLNNKQMAVNNESNQNEMLWWR